MYVEENTIYKISSAAVPISCIMMPMDYLYEVKFLEYCVCFTTQTYFTRSTQLKISTFLNNQNSVYFNYSYYKNWSVYRYMPRATI